MQPFNREKFLLWLFAGLLGWQASVFTYGTVMCANVKAPQTVRTACPELADNYNKFVQTTLGAVLGLLAGSATQRSSASGPDASASPLPPQPGPLPGPSVSPAPQERASRGRGQVPPNS